jgi:heavy metal translocating P-type ATPase
VTGSQSGGTLCQFCGEEIGGEGSYCSRGCERVDETLGSQAAGDTSADTIEHPSPKSVKTQSEAPDSDRTRTHLRVEGMYSTTCEAFLEARAADLEGVHTADASYVSETIRIVHEADSVSIDELCDHLSVLGYDATPRSDVPVDSAARTSDRQFDSLLGYRYVAGVVFGSFMLLTYVTVIYPAQIAALLGGAGAFGGTSGGLAAGARLALLLPYLGLTGVVLFFTGSPLLRGAYVSLKMRQPTTELLVSMVVVAAYVYSAVAILLGRIDVFFDLTIVVAAGVVAAMFYESLVKQRAVDQLTDLTLADLDEASRLQDDETTVTVAVDDLEVGDHILVRQGERIPVDGILVGDRCTVDESVVTGESLPVRKTAGDDLLGGSVVTEDAAVVEVTDESTSTVEAIVESVWDLQSLDHGVQRRANRLAARAIPIVTLLIVSVAVGAIFQGRSLPVAFLIALTAVIALTPWALGLATPLSVATSIEEASQHGLVVFDETVFERLRAIDTIVFDKTGTLTTGTLQVVASDAPNEDLEAAAALESRGVHPAATAIASTFGSDGESAVPVTTDDGASDGATARTIESFTNHDLGVSGQVDGDEMLVGDRRLFEEQEWTIDADISQRIDDAADRGHLPVVVGRDGTATGVITLGDEPRQDWRTTLERLSDRGHSIVVLTGDDTATASRFTHPAVDHVFSGVSPEGKTATIHLLQRDGDVAMVGDGTNDAPALAKADLGLSLGSGTVIASDAADIAIVDAGLTAVETVFDLADAANSRVRQNNGLAFVYNSLAIPLAAIGLLNPILAMAAALTTGALIGLNSSRDLVSG